MHLRPLDLTSAVLGVLGVLAVLAGCGGARNTFGGLVGADDIAYKLARFEPAERREIVAQVLHDRGEPAAP